MTWQCYAKRSVAFELAACIGVYSECKNCCTVTESGHVAWQESHGNDEDDEEQGPESDKDASSEDESQATSPRSPFAHPQGTHQPGDTPACASLQPSLHHCQISKHDMVMGDVDAGFASGWRAGVSSHLLTITCAI